MSQLPDGDRDVETIDAAYAFRQAAEALTRGDTDEFVYWHVAARKMQNGGRIVVLEDRRTMPGSRRARK